MTRSTLAHCRSLLFLPASNPRAIEKARALDADLIILDLEDAVRVEDKEMARGAAVEALASGFGGRLTALRINADPRWHLEDCAAARSSAADFIVVPKVPSGAVVTNHVVATGKPVLAMIETAAGVLAARGIAEPAAGLLVGANDLALDLRLPPSTSRAGMVHALQAVVLAARAAGVPVFDGVYNQLEDAGGLERECMEGKAFGFDGKSLIHPSQTEITNRVFAPSEVEIAAAERLIAAAGGGAQRFEGRLIEDLHVEQARALLARAGR